MPLSWLALPALALVLLAAHFYRAAAWPLVLLALGLLVLLLAWPRAWVARGVQLALVLGAMEWLRTLVVLVQARLALDQPWLRLALILVGVAGFTAGATLVFRRQRVRDRYRLDRAGGDSGRR
jgi:hypothetical protein